ncbi:MAG TPA: class I SAM-dependent methyltransferase [Polyangiaceae bacterium]|nr:class I SAM-dependent methyltransferase [Polyangiaceae bacterium]
MSVFGSYSRYYNLLYRDKDYAGEADYIRSLIEKYRPGAKTVLDLGCGTGRHAQLLAGHGYELVGVDRSTEMLNVARQNASAAGGAARTEFLEGDVRSVRLGRTFDVVVSLFHVMSYQNSNADLRAALATMRTHLAPGGLFIFDCWYGPAVLSLKPSTRILRLEDSESSVTRLAEPVLHATANVVDVNYHVFVKDKASAQVTELRETHSMRYLFSPEVELLAGLEGLRIDATLAFRADSPPGFDTWTAVFLGGHAS